LRGWLGFCGEFIMLEKQMEYATTISTGFDAKLMVPTTRKKLHQTSFQLSFHGNWPSLCRKYGKHHKQSGNESNFCLKN
jgi:hypothetical protein